MKNNTLTIRLWFRFFLKVTVVFLSFVLFIMICNSLFLDDYYISRQKVQLIENRSKIEALDLTNKNATMKYLTELYEKSGVETEIYSISGATLYTTYGGQIFDFLYGPEINNNNFNMIHKQLTVLSSKTLPDGSVIETAKEPQNEVEYIVYRVKKSNYYIETRTRIQLLESSAAVANNFILLIIIVCLGLGVIAIIFVSYRSAKPIAEMNSITKNMAALDFSKKISEESKDEIGQLAVSINELSDTLDATLKDLREKNLRLENEIEKERELTNMRRGFVANVSHELKTPISIIGGYAEALKENIDSSKKEMYCDTIIDESKRMNKLVLTLLNLSKVEHGAHELNQTEFNIKDLLEMLSVRIIGQENLVLELEDIMVLADPDLIEQALKSYLENALSHNTGKVTVKCFKRDEKAVVEVNNDGEQIDEAKTPQLWQSFYRGDTSHKRDNTRFGLGLSIVNAIVKLHKETCGVYNTKNGVTFWLTLKCSEEPKTEN